ncbi:MAG: radical SAM protein [Desulfosoma sp.]
MKVLLINSNTFKQPWPVIPFGLCCVAAAVEQAGHDVTVLDLCFASNPAEAIRKAVAQHRPDVVGISVRNIDNSVGFQTQFLLESTKTNVIEPCKQSFSGPIVLGGPALGINGREMLEFFGVPFAIAGDGEEAMVSFLGRIRDGAPLEDVPGLIYRSSNGTVVEHAPSRVRDLNSLPVVDPSRYLDLKPYLQYNSPLQVQTKRGCPLACVYCTYNRIEGRTYRLKKPERVVDEIALLVEKTGIRCVEFTDSTFNIPLPHAKNVLKLLIARQLHLQVRTMGLNPGAVDEELVELMKKAGFTEVDVGAESGSDRMLESLGKNFRKKDILRTGELLQKAGIPVTWYLLLGAPGETTQTLQETFETMEKAAASWDLINVAVGIRLYNGAPITERVRKDFPSLAVEKRNFLFPAHLPDSYGLDVHTIKDLTKRQAMRKSNYYMYDEDEKTPPALLRCIATLYRLGRIQQPLWRSFILLRRLQKITGYTTLRRFLYESRMGSKRQPAKLSG